MRNEKKEKKNKNLQQQQNSQQLPILHYSNKHSTIQFEFTLSAKSHIDSDMRGLDPPHITFADKNLPPSRD
jgi:hypothetical protein